MSTVWARCEGAFIGHAIASQYDPSIFMALNVAESLIQFKEYNGPDILARHLYLYHTKRCEVGEITKYIYQAASTSINSQSPTSRETFCFNPSKINGFVQSAHDRTGGYTASCGPAQRSYPLAFCAYITDDNLVDITMQEARLTHQSPIAGQVAVIVNSICRSLLRNHNWQAAVNSAFTQARLHDDVKNILMRHGRWPNPLVETHPAYAPTILNSVLHYVSASRSVTEALELAKYAKNKTYCLPIVGILAGARWGVSEDMYKSHIDNADLTAMRTAANKLINLWPVSRTDVSV
ncbi:unnamed protein product [Adineta ricciae]|uniref:Uncharacterized protein n=1 Tax=Adineta ricciae TaxID=249248 RepID=A0A814WGL8_ADIRI|nr:unnamed protein product [Adineta ricciae]